MNHRREFTIYVATQERERQRTTDTKLTERKMCGVGSRSQRLTLCHYLRSCGPSFLRSSGDHPGLPESLGCILNLDQGLLVGGRPG